MVLAKVIGTVVSTAKVAALSGKTLVICRSMESIGESGFPESDSATSFVAVDLVGAPEGSVVMVVTGSAAREMSGAPVDAAVSGIVDYTVVGGKRAVVE